MDDHVDRVAFAEAHHADVFLSLHFNTSGGGKEQAGLETYCLTPTGMRSSLTRGYEDDPAEVLPNNAFDAENLQWAIRLHAALLKLDGVADRGVRRARFLGVLRTQKRPAVLIEGGFLSVPPKRGGSQPISGELAETIAAAVMNPTKSMSSSPAAPSSVHIWSTIASRQQERGCRG